MGKISVHDKIVIKNFRQRKDRISKFLHELPCKGELMHHGVLTSHYLILDSHHCLRLTYSRPIWRHTFGNAKNI